MKSTSHSTYQGGMNPLRKILLGALLICSLNAAFSYPPHFEKK